MSFKQPEPQRTASDNWEPRVVKLETGLELLTKDVNSLVAIVREQSHNIEGEIQKLAIAVTQASAPKKTEWHTLIALGLLLMTLGSAVFWPLNQTAQNNKDDIQVLRKAVEQHIALDSHPVSAALFKRNDDRLNKLESNNEERNKEELEELHALRRKVVEYHMGAIPQMK